MARKAATVRTVGKWVVWSGCREGAVSVFRVCRTSAAAGKAALEAWATYDTGRHPDTIVGCTWLHPDRRRFWQHWSCFDIPVPKWPPSAIKRWPRPGDSIAATIPDASNTTCLFAGGRKPDGRPPRRCAVVP